MNTIIDQHILDELTVRAKVLSQSRMNLDLRNSPADTDLSWLQGWLTRIGYYVAVTVV